MEGRRGSLRETRLKAQTHEAGKSSYYISTFISARDRVELSEGLN